MVTHPSLVGNRKENVSRSAFWLEWVLFVKGMVILSYAIHDSLVMKHVLYHRNLCFVSLTKIKIRRLLHC